MALTTGSRIGPYEVTSPLGEGGMGVVFRAHDTKLRRDVALKALPEHLADDPDRLSRFQREAQALASLNHPNIAQIYGLEESPSTRCIVMELVEGETIEELLRRGPVPIDEALAVATQIAEALEAAHERGIAHRDLKPANIKLTPDGKVKVLDFGLAKVFEYRQPITLSNSPTLMSGSVPGVILGTAAYMSPEQAKGLSADQRSDIFSFGCILFEMLTARQAFTGDTASEILASVLKSEVDLTLLPANLNPRVRELLSRCLEKSPKSRWHAAADLRLELESLIKSGTVTDEIRAAQSRPLWKRGTPVAVAILLTAMIAGTAAWYFRPSADLPVARLALVLPDTERLDSTWRSIAISPDGAQVVYGANRQLYLRSVSEFEAKPISGTHDVLSATSPAFSPDGRSIAFWAVGDQTIKSVPITGGSAITLARVQDATALGIVGLSWSEYGIVFGQGNRGIMQISDKGGEPKLLVKASGPEAVGFPQMLPGGKAILFSVVDRTGDRMQVVTQSLASAERKILLERKTGDPRAVLVARYIDTGHIVYFQNGTLFAAPFNLRRLELSGDPVQVVQGVRTSGNLDPLLGFSEKGSLIYVSGPFSASERRYDLALTDRNGVTDRLRLPPRSYENPRVSPDGKRVAFGLNDGAESSIWTYDLSHRTVPNRLTLEGKNQFPVWSPDGQRIAFQSDRQGDLAIYWQRADGTGAAERLTKPGKGVAHAPESWSPDGDTLLFREIKESSVSLWALSMRDLNASAVDGIQSVGPTYAVFSPDGRWIAYQVYEPGKLSEIYVQPFPPTGARYQLPISRDNHHPAWSHDGKDLFYVPGPGEFAVIHVTTTPSFAFGNPTAAPKILEHFAPVVPRPYDVTPDGRLIGLVVSEAAQPGTAITGQINVVINWFAELRRRVPVH